MIQDEIKRFVHILAAAMSIELTELLGAKVILTSDGGWTAEQQDPELEIEYPEGHAPISWSYGSIRV